MRHVRWNGQALPGAHDVLAAVADKFNRSALHHRDLLVDVMMLGDHAALAQFDARDGHILPVNHFAAEVGVHALAFELLPCLKFHGGYCSGFARAGGYCFSRNAATSALSAALRASHT